MDNHGFSCRHRLRSFRFAWQGLRILPRLSDNARIQLALAVLAIVLGLWLGLTAGEWAALGACIAAVLAAEAFNTALELLADRISPDYDATIGRAKDLAAGAVLLTAAGAVVVGAWLFLPKLWRLLV